MSATLLQGAHPRPAVGAKRRPRALRRSAVSPLLRLAAQQNRAIATHRLAASHGEDFFPSAQIPNVAHGDSAPEVGRDPAAACGRRECSRSVAVGRLSALRDTQAWSAGRTAHHAQRSGIWPTAHSHGYLRAPVASAQRPGLSCCEPVKDDDVMLRLVLCTVSSVRASNAVTPSAQTSAACVAAYGAPLCCARIASGGAYAALVGTRLSPAHTPAVTPPPSAAGATARTPAMRTGLDDALHVEEAPLAAPGQPDEVGGAEVGENEALGVQRLEHGRHGAHHGEHLGGVALLL